MKTLVLDTGRTHLELDPWGFFPCTVKAFKTLQPLIVEGCQPEHLAELIADLWERAAVAKIDKSPKGQRFAAKLLRNVHDLEQIAADMFGYVSPAEIAPEQQPEPEAPAPAPALERPKARRRKNPDWIGKTLTAWERKPKQQPEPAAPPKPTRPDWIGRKMIITIGERSARPAG